MPTYLPLVSAYTQYLSLVKFVSLYGINEFQRKGEQKNCWLREAYCWMPNAGKLTSEFNLGCKQIKGEKNLI